MVEWSLRR